MSKASIKKKFKLEPEDEVQLKEAFAVFDVSGDGNIDANELQTILKAVNKSKTSIEDVRDMIAAVDEGKDGEIGLSEFLQLMAEQMQSKKQEEELIAAFKMFGANSSEDVISF